MSDKLPEKLRITVGINSLTNTTYESYTNHIQTFFKFGRSYPNIEFILSNPARMSIDRMRNMTANVALESESNYLLFMDDDVLIQPDSLQRLLDAKADIAAGKVVIRGYPFDWMIFTERKLEGHKGLFSCPDLPDKGLFKCDAVGFSFCLIKTSVLKSIEAPFFVTGLNNTEDIYFCVKAKQVNPKLSIVCECSVNCGHILWPEVMNAGNRLAYKKYFEAINPQILAQRKLEAKFKNNPRGDRSADYLKDVKEVSK